MNRNSNVRHRYSRPENRLKTAPFDAKAMKEALNSLIKEDEISYLVKSCIDKGNNISKLTGDTKFKRIWEIIESEDGVSPSRICHAFPVLTCKYLQNCPTRPFSLQACVEASECADFPTIARHSACASLIPENFNFRAEALEVVMMTSMLFSEKIQNTEDWAELTPAKKFRHNFEFVMKSFRSNVLSEGDRWELSGELGIVTEQGILTDAWTEASDGAGRWLQKNYKCSLRAYGTSDVKVYPDEKTTLPELLEYLSI